MTQLNPGEQRVRVGIDEPGNESPALQVHHVRRPGRARRPDRDDAPAADPDAGAGGQEPAAVEDAAVAEEQVAGGSDSHPLPPCGRGHRPTSNQLAQVIVNAYDITFDRRKLWPARASAQVARSTRGVNR